MPPEELKLVIPAGVFPMTRSGPGDPHGVCGRSGRQAIAIEVSMVVPSSERREDRVREHSNLHATDRPRRPPRTRPGLELGKSFRPPPAGGDSLRMEPPGLDPRLP